MHARYRQNLVGAVAGSQKVIVRSEGIAVYDLDRDAEEPEPRVDTLGDFIVACRRQGISQTALGDSLDHLGQWAERA
jgi:hypothetical protein